MFQLNILVRTSIRSKYGFILLTIGTNSFQVSSRLERSVQRMVSDITNLHKRAKYIADPNVFLLRYLITIIPNVMLQLGLLREALNEVNNFQGHDCSEMNDLEVELMNISAAL